MILFSKEPVSIDVEKEKVYLQKLLRAQGCNLEDFNCTGNEFSFKLAYPPTISLWKIVSCIKTGVRWRLKGQRGRFWDNIYCLVSSEGNKSEVLETVKVYLD
jgi:hypothetical protein